MSQNTSQYRVDEGPDGGNTQLDEGWIQQTEKSMAKDSRTQPWKETMAGKKVDTGFEGKDVKHVRSGDDVQHTGVAG